MAQHSNNGEEDPISNDLPSLSLSAQSTTETEISPPFLTLPDDLLIEFLCTFPVILLLRLRRVCKRFNNLISGPEFVEEHLRMSKKRHHLIVTSEIDGKDDLSALYHSSISSVFSTSTVVTQKLLHPPKCITDQCNLSYANVMYSCNGILCGTIKDGFFFLWNPSINKFKEFRLLKFPQKRVIAFGYCKSIDKYKFVAVSVKNKVSVHTLGTDTSWKSIQGIPCDCRIDGSEGIFVGDTVNWLANSYPTRSLFFVLSLDVAEVSYQKLSLPNFENENVRLRLGVVNDCLYVLAVSNKFSDVWIMKQYGDPESWAKYRIPNTMMQELSLEARYVLYHSADNQMLLQCYEMGNPNEMFHEMRSPNNMTLVVYDFNTGTLNIPEFQKYGMEHPIVYIESLKTLPKDSTAT